MFFYVLISTLLATHIMLVEFVIFYNSKNKKHYANLSQSKKIK